MAKSKTDEAIEGLNETQKTAMKKVCNSELPEAPNKGWQYTGAGCHGKCAAVLENKGLLSMKVTDTNHYIVKPTALGRRVGKALLACILALILLPSCGDKIQTAKTTMAFVSLGVPMATTAFDAFASTQKTKCLKKGIEDSAEYVECYKSAADILAKWASIKPRLEKAIANAASYIKAAESGKGGDYAVAVKESVCLLSEVLAIIPGDWKKKIESYIALAGAYTCDNPAAGVSPACDLEMLKMAHRLMTELLSESV